MDEYFGRFIKKVNQMKSFGEEVPNKKIMEKILDSLPEKFNPMVAIIEETKDISKLSVQELMGSLKTHEKRLNQHSKKSVESAFQSKLMLSSINEERGFTSSPRQNFNGGGHGRGRGRGQNFKGRERGSYIG